PRPARVSIHAIPRARALHRSGQGKVRPDVDLEQPGHASACTARRRVADFRRRAIMRTQILAAAVLSCIGLAACNQQSPSGMQSPQSPTAQPPADNGSTMGRKVDDAAITAKVKAALLAANDVKGTDISVETNSGRVTLSGVVHDQRQADRAVTTARTVDGV